MNLDLNQRVKAFYLRLPLWGWLLIMFFFLFIMEFDHYEGTKQEENYSLMLFISIGDWLSYGIYALVIFLITTFWYPRSFHRYIAILIYVTFFCCSYNFNKNIELKEKNKSKEFIAKNDFFRMLKDTCVSRTRHFKTEQQTQDGCNCMVEKAQVRWTEKEINTDGFALQKGIGDSVVVWISDCFNGAGFYGVGKTKDDIYTDQKQMFDSICKTKFIGSKLPDSAVNEICDCFSDKIMQNHGMSSKKQALLFDNECCQKYVNKHGKIRL